MSLLKCSVNNNEIFVIMQPELTCAPPPYQASTFNEPSTTPTQPNCNNPIPLPPPPSYDQITRTDTQEEFMMNPCLGESPDQRLLPAYTDVQPIESWILSFIYLENKDDNVIIGRLWIITIFITICTISFLMKAKDHGYSVRL